MKRRDLCGMGVVAGAAALLPMGRLAAAADSVQGADVRAVKLSGAETTLERAAISDLRRSLSGTLLIPGDDGYENARHVWNGMIDKHPALIARCADTADVVRAVTFARERELLLAVRGGGHSFPGYSTCEGGLVVDLSGMRSVVVRAADRSVRAGGGAWGAHVDAAAQQQSLVTTLGQISNTGVAGLTLGGGFGWLSRRFGLACDNLIGVELVTADGKTRHVSAQDEPDLFWALRGGGGNFGVATALEYRLHPFNPTVIAGQLAFPAAQVKEAIEFYASLITHAPRELSVDLGLTAGEDGAPSAEVYVVYSGDARTAAKVLEPLQRFGKPTRNTIKEQSYLVVQTWFDPPPIDPTHWYLKGGFVSEYSPKLIAALADEFRPDAATSMYFQSANGAVADLPTGATAFSHRGAIANMMLFGLWKDRAQDEAGRDRIRSVWSKLAPFTDGYYVNLHDTDAGGKGTDKGTESNYGANFARLAQVKKQYDPLNLFRLNANIKAA
ncbi:MAG: FAD-binding oxidoreductase [Gammaproteobacteria bacterium]|nr:FAD-binding oxidoreductase [Gammaproteobacteria bacterium]